MMNFNNVGFSLVCFNIYDRNNYTREILMWSTEEYILLIDSQEIINSRTPDVVYRTMKCVNKYPGNYKFKDS